MGVLVALVLVVLLDLAALRWGADSRVDERAQTPRQYGILR
jgi:hypothetical protein